MIVDTVPSTDELGPFVLAHDTVHALRESDDPQLRLAAAAWLRAYALATRLHFSADVAHRQADAAWQRAVDQSREEQCQAGCGAVARTVQLAVTTSGRTWLRWYGAAIAAGFDEDTAQQMAARAAEKGL